MAAAALVQLAALCSGCEVFRVFLGALPDGGAAVDLAGADLTMLRPSTCDPPQFDLGLRDCGQGVPRTAINFLDEVKVALAGLPTAAVVVDLDGDGREEVVVAEGASYQILGNQGDGLLRAGKPLPLPLRATQVAAGDFDGDGDQDLVFAGDKSIEFQRNGGGCGFSHTLTVDTDLDPNALRVGTLDFDRAHDVAFTSPTPAPGGITEGILYGRAGFELPMLRGFAATSGVVGHRAGLAVVDLDGDLLDDLVLVESGLDQPGPLDASVASGSGLEIRFSERAGGLRPDVQFVVAHNRVLGVEAADLDGDGARELVVRYHDPPGAGRPTDGVVVLHNNRSVAQPTSPRVEYALDGEALFTAAGDFDFDGRADLIIATGGPRPGLVPVRSAGSITLSSVGGVRPVGAGVTALFSTYIDCDPYPDLVVLRGGASIGVMLSVR